MNSTSEDIKDFLVAVNSSLVFATNLFIGQEPVMPNSCITIFDTTSQPRMTTFARGEDYMYPNIQIRVRDESFTDGYDLISSICDYLHARGHVIINETTYSLIQCVSEPSHLDYDNKKRPRFVANLNIQRFPYLDDEPINILHGEYNVIHGDDNVIKP